MWHENILGTIGETPLVRINRLAMGLPCTVLAKVEFFNPGGSVKDRIGVSLIDAAERDGLPRPGGTIIEVTRGNTRAGLALVAVARGYRCIFTTTDKQSQEKIDVLRALGAEVIVCPTHVAPDDPRSYYSVARRLSEEIPNAVYLNQYDNLANTEAHYQSTGPELWRQTDGRITHYFAGAGTGGTISGTGKYLKEQNAGIKVVGVDPFGSVYHKYFHESVFDDQEIYPYLIEGVGEDILAKNMDFSVIDDYVQITDKDAMLETRRLSRMEGLFVGQSSGMAMAGALQWLRAHRSELRAEEVVVVILPDSGFRYLSKTYNDSWMQNHGFIEAKPDLTVEQILSMRRKKADVVFVSPDESLQAAIERMNEYGISQMPVLEGENVVGSLTENGILNLLIENPTARKEAVRSVMGDPFPIVPVSLHLEHLSSFLEQGTGAVLVHLAGERPFEIITKSDLISALSTSGRNGNGQEE